MMAISRAALRPAAVPATIVAVILIGAVLRANAALANTGDQLWTVALWVIGAGITWRTLAEARKGHFATDVVATLAIVTAVIMRQPLAGLIVALMQTGGEALEDYARGRASRALHALEEAAPRLAHRINDGIITDIAVDAIAIGDRLLVRPGELVPCDGVIIGGESHLDASRLTGCQGFRGASRGACLRGECRRHSDQQRIPTP